jgi:ADP-ribose pyrophosphatase YjhB (NUDIX family)
MDLSLKGRGRGALLVCWRYLPLWARWLAIRVLYPRFPVGAVALVRDRQGRVLLVRQTYHRRELWGAPGGWVGRGETPRQAAARETWEELGMRIAVGRVLAIGSGPYGEVSLAFDCHALGEEGPRLGQEVDRAGFFRLDELPPMPRGTQRLVEEAADALGALPARVEGAARSPAQGRAAC